MYDWSFASSAPRCRSSPAAMLCDPRVVAGREPVAAGARANASSSAKRKLPLQRTHGFGVSPRAYARTNGVTIGATELLAQIERDVRKAQPMAGLARSDHRLRRAAGALGVGAVGIEPEAERDADRVPAGAQQRNRAVDAAAHRDRRSAGDAFGAKDGPIAFASASTASVSPPTAAASSSVSPASERSSPGASASTMRSPSMRSAPPPSRRRASSLRRPRSCGHGSEKRCQAPLARCLAPSTLPLGSNHVNLA